MTTPAVEGAESGGAARDRRRDWISGFALGLGINLVIILGVVYLKWRDTSVNPWETFATAAFATALCIGTVEFLVGAALVSFERRRWFGIGMVVGCVVGVSALVVMGIVGGSEATSYGRANHLIGY